MSTTGWVILAIVVGAVVVAAIAAMKVMDQRRRTALRDRFGPEYDRTVSGSDSRRKAEQELRDAREAVRVDRHQAAVGSVAHAVHGGLGPRRADVRRRSGARSARGRSGRPRTSSTSADTRATTTRREPPPFPSTIRTSCSGTATGTTWCIRTGSRRRSGRRTSVRPWSTSARCSTRWSSQSTSSRRAERAQGRAAEGVGTAPHRGSGVL